MQRFIVELRQESIEQYLDTCPHKEYRLVSVSDIADRFGYVHSHTYVWELNPYVMSTISKI